MDVVLYILAALFIAVSVAGSILPGIPGPPLGYVGLLLLQATDKVQYSTAFLVTWGIVVVAVSVLDYYIPVLTTKGFGGSRYGVRGSIVGMIIGIIFTPIGIILGTLLGAVIGEMIGGSNLGKAISSGFGAFFGTMLSSGIKLIICVTFVIYYIMSFF